jgi:hypothetical protein
LLGSTADQTGRGLDNPAQQPRYVAPAPEVSSSATAEVSCPPVSLLTTRKSRRQLPPLPSQSEGYNVSDLAEYFGFHHSRIESWARRGLLGKPRGHGGHGGNIRFAEKNIVRFIRRHPSEYDLGRVDKTWFKFMVFGRYAGSL